MLLKIIVQFLILLIPLTPVIADTAGVNPALSREERIWNAAQARKDPTLSSVLSLLYSGTGQFYNGQFNKGSLFFLGETACHLANLGLLFKLKNDYSGSTSLSFIDMALGDQALVLSSILVLISVKLLCIMDAYQSSTAINADIVRNLGLVRFDTIPGGYRISCGIAF